MKTTYEFLETKTNSYVRFDGKIENLKIDKIVTPDLQLRYLNYGGFNFKCEATSLSDAKIQWADFLKNKRFEKINKRNEEILKFKQIELNLQLASAKDIFSLMCFYNSKGESWALTRFIIDTKNSLTEELHLKLGNSYTFSTYDDGSFIIKGINGKRLSNFITVKNQINLD